MTPTPTDDTPLIGDRRNNNHDANDQDVRPSLFVFTFDDFDVVDANTNYHWILALGILNVIGGILCLAVPVMAAVMAEWIVSYTLILVGGFNLSGVCWGEPGTRPHFFLLGLVQVFLGILMLNNPFGTLMILGILIAVKVFLDGVLMLAACFQNRQLRGWGLFLASGLASVIVGAVVLMNLDQGSAIVLIGIVLGVNLLTVGSIRIHIALEGRTRN